MQRAARVIGRQVLVLKAGTEHEIEGAFAALVRERAGALLVGADTFFTSQATLFVVLTAHHSIPTIYPFKSYVEAGGLMSYGTSLLDAYRQSRCLRRARVERRKTRRPAGRAADQVRTDHQP